MKVRLALVCIKDPGFWRIYVPQGETIIHEVIVEIPDLPLYYIVDRAMICEYEEEC